MTQAAAMAQDVALKIVARKDITILLWLHTEADPTSEYWDVAVEQLRKLRETVPVERMRSLVITDGGAPNLAQRKQVFTDIVPGIRTSVVTPSLNNPIKRGVATAISWINPAFRAVGPAQIVTALEHLEIKDLFISLWPEFVRMQELMPPVKALDMVAQQMGFSAPPRRAVAG